MDSHATSINLLSRLNFIPSINYKNDGNLSPAIHGFESTDSKIKYQLIHYYDSTSFVICEENYEKLKRTDKIVIRAKLENFDDLEKILLAKNAIDNLYKEFKIDVKVVLYLSYIVGNGIEFNKIGSKQLNILVNILNDQNFYKIYVYEPYDIDYLNKLTNIDFDVHPNKKWHKTSMIQNFSNIIQKYDNNTCVVFAYKKLYDQYMPLIKIINNNINDFCYADILTNNALLIGDNIDSAKKFVIIDSGIYSGTSLNKIIKSIKKLYGNDVSIDVITAHMDVFSICINTEVITKILDSVNVIYCTKNNSDDFENCFIDVRKKFALVESIY